jgi:hypothetical protein
MGLEGKWGCGDGGRPADWGSSGGYRPCEGDDAGRSHGRRHHEGGEGATELGIGQPAGATHVSYEPTNRTRTDAD